MVDVVSNSSISGIENNAAFSIANSRTLTVGDAGLTNHGTVAPASTGSITNLFITGAGPDSSVSIGGTGSIILDSATERILGTTNHGLEHETDHTIRGAGQFGANAIDIINRGTIAADIPAGELRSDDRNGGMVNSGTLSASGGGMLVLTDPLAQEDGTFVMRGQ